MFMLQFPDNRFSVFSRNLARSRYIVPLTSPSDANVTTKKIKKSTPVNPKTHLLHQLLTLKAPQNYKNQIHCLPKTSIVHVSLRSCAGLRVGLAPLTIDRGRSHYREKNSLARSVLLAAGSVVAAEPQSRALEPPLSCGLCAAYLPVYNNQAFTHRSNLSAGLSVQVQRRLIIITTIIIPKVRVCSSVFEIRRTVESVCGYTWRGATVHPPPPPRSTSSSSHERARVLLLQCGCSNTVIFDYLI